MAVVHIEVKNGVAHVELDRPPLNVLDLPAAAELATAIESAVARGDVDVILLAGRGRAFCAGVDVRDHLPDRGAEMLRTFHRACVALLEAPQPVVAMVHGAALGGGCELTLCCDLVIASTQASFGQPEIRLGVFPPLAAVALPRMIRFHDAAELLFTGRVMDASEAARIGLANRVVEPAALASAVRETLDGLAALSPASLRLAREALRQSRVRPTAAEVAEAERFYLDRVMRTPDAIEGLQAFLEKRQPQWRGARRAPEVSAG
jgi:cyclohexa-1,5-dienecarbonyl-CoA hydratase